MVPKIIESGKKFGNMNTNPKFYSGDVSKEEARRLFLENRMAFGREFGFDGHYMFMADQKKGDGSYFNVTSDYVLEHPNGWSDIEEDILHVSADCPGVVIGHAVADCPVIIMSDYEKGITGIAHCSAALIDKGLPLMLADSLLDAAYSSDDSLNVYVGACASDKWIYDIYPPFAKDEKLWKDAIWVDDDGFYHIDMRKAIAQQLKERNIDFSKVRFNMDDTISNPNYFSNSLGRLDEAKAGRHFTGAFYDKPKIKIK